MSSAGSKSRRHGRAERSEIPYQPGVDGIRKVAVNGGDDAEIEVQRWVHKERGAGKQRDRWRGTRAVDPRDAEQFRRPAQPPCHGNAERCRPERGVRTGLGTRDAHPRVRRIEVHRQAVHVVARDDCEADVRGARTRAIVE